MNKHISLQETFNINQVEWSADFLGDTMGGQSVNRLRVGRGQGDGGESRSMQTLLSTRINGEQTRGAKTKAAL